ncbi:hypothetical protein [Grimontia hollisae]|uniref:Uncharacterized protein n=1 Tax=Grimontia hollisae TaxID=673 RepID=A0A377JAD7_GRIHO|nr:hypothetical protein [Grimontia hollisae]STO98957.1 Uncharacterised protein [Grimontia hollisae]STR61834.1 Uncharacterised protein [Grimontia hollisae]
MTEDHYPEITLEEYYRGYTIYVENNPDQYTGGYEYSVSDGENILKEGLEFDADAALQAAKDYIDTLI